MPTYEYACRACGHEFEEFQSIKADPIKVCPACRKRKVERKIGTGGAVIFKGGGFYETDYRSESYRSGAEAEKKARDAKPAASAGSADSAPTEAKSGSGSQSPSGSDSKSKPEAKSESRTEAKSETKSDAKSDAKAEPKSQQKRDAKPDQSAVSAENKRIEARATHRSRIGRGVGNIVKKKSAPRK